MTGLMDEGEGNSWHESKGMKARIQARSAQLHTGAGSLANPCMLSAPAGRSLTTAADSHGCG